MGVNGVLSLLGSNPLEALSSPSVWDDPHGSSNIQLFSVICSRHRVRVVAHCGILVSVQKDLCYNLFPGC